MIEVPQLEMAVSDKQVLASQVVGALRSECGWILDLGSIFRRAEVADKRMMKGSKEI